MLLTTEGTLASKSAIVARSAGSSASLLLPLPLLLAAGLLVGPVLLLAAGLEALEASLAARGKDVRKCGCSCACMFVVQ